MKSTQGINYLRHLMIGMDELSWLQAEAHEMTRNALLGKLMTTGVVTGRTTRGGLDTIWRVHDDNDDGTLSIMVASVYTDSIAGSGIAWAVTPQGYPLTERVAKDIIAVPDDNTWYTVVMRKSLNTTERGQITLIAGDATVTGTDTEFTRFAGYTTDGFQRGTKLYINTGGANDGEWEIDSVTSDTSLELRATANGNEGPIDFEVAGQFYGGSPASPQLHQRWEPAYSLVARVRDPAAGTDSIVLADVKRNDAGGPPKVQIIDRRARNLLCWLPEECSAHGVAVSMDGMCDLAGAWTVGLPDVSAGFVGSADGVSLVRSEDDTIWAAVSSAGVINTSLFTHYLNNWAPPGVTIVGAGADRCPALVQVPSQSGNTHLIFYTTAGPDQVQMRSTTDNGATWSGPTAVWSPDTIDPNNDVQYPMAILLANHRLLLFASLHDDAGVGFYNIRYIYSDDYGATWNTNGELGYDIYHVHANCTLPYAAQGPDGVVYCVFLHIGAPSYIEMIRSSDATGILWAGAPSVLRVEQSFNDDSMPAVWVGEQNLPIAFYNNQVSGGVMDIRYAVVGRDKTTLADSTIVSRSLLRSGVAAGSQRIWLVENRAGHLMLAFVDETPAAHQVLTMTLYPMALDLHVMPQQ